MSRAVLAIHGGAGTLSGAEMTPAQAEAYRGALRTSLRAGHAVLASGGSALDAVTEAVAAMENDPLFNAGRGAVLTSDGVAELDAAVMDGTSRACGAVACVRGVRNPVRAARLVMKRTEHVLLAGPEAERFLRDQGAAFAPATYFLTQRRIDALQRELARRAAGAPDRRSDADRHGTVGAVACDPAGRLAAATSTGGLTGKRPGRVGDTPLFGAGTWAENGACAVSTTGQGEFFIRHAVAHDAACRMRYLGESLEAAAGAALAGMGADGGTGGLIAVDGSGRIALPFNTEGMYRGAIGADGVPRVAIYAEALA